MTAALVGLKERLRLPGMLLTFGLLVESICPLWARPIAFILLLMAAGFLCAAGTAMYLYSLVSAGGATPER